MKGYGVKQNINFAFGLTEFSEEEEPNNEDYGTIKMYYDYWDDVDYELKEIKTRPCIPDDFQIENESQNAKFFKADEKYLTEIKRNMKMLKCTEEPLNFIGNFETGKA